MKSIQKNTIYLAVVLMMLSCQDNSIPPDDTSLDVNTDLENFSVRYDHYDDIYTVNVTVDLKTDEVISRTGDVDVVEGLMFGDVPRAMTLTGSRHVKIFDTQEERIAYEAKLYGLELDEYLGLEEEEAIDEHHEEIAGGRTNTHCTHSIIGQTNGTTIRLLDGSSQIASISNQRILKTVLANSLQNRADWVEFNANGQNGNGETFICCNQVTGACTTEDRRIMNIVLYDANCPNGGSQLSLTLPFLEEDQLLCPGNNLLIRRKHLNFRRVSLGGLGWSNKTNSYNAQVWIKG